MSWDTGYPLDAVTRAARVGVTGGITGQKVTN